jgi:PhnB protein
MEGITMKMNTYVNYGGNCAESFRYYEQHLGGKIMGMMKWSQMPDADKQTPPGFENDILHGRIDLGETVLMGADVPGALPMRSAYLSLSVTSSEEAERIYAALADGGEIFMKMGETFFAYRFGQLRDKFGISWMVIHEKPMG